MPGHPAEVTTTSPPRSDLTRNDLNRTALTGTDVTSTDVTGTASTPMDRLLAGLEAGVSVDLGRHLMLGPALSDRRLRAECLLAIYQLKSGRVDDTSRWAEHPSVATLRWQLESQWLSELEETALPAGMPALAPAPDGTLSAAVVRALRWLAARDRLPEVYSWVARIASLPELVRFLALEGGPDAGFDDLVAACQVGLVGRPKLELAVNYWDEMGDGDLEAVHTTEHERMAGALGIVAIAREDQSVEGLERSALCGLLAANHWLQPEMLGALGLIELQAGPRCRLVTQGLRRTGAPAEAFPFYDVHAEVDPRHGNDWLRNAVAPLVDERPEWAARIVRGAWWRSLVNARFFEQVAAGLPVAASLRAAA